MMGRGAAVVASLWAISAFSYAASVGRALFADNDKRAGVIAVVLLLAAALITRTRLYLKLYDRQVLRSARTPVVFLRILTWALLFFTICILYLHFQAASGTGANSSNALLSIFAFITFMAGRSLLLRPFSK
jgi:hypothetical protein